MAIKPISKCISNINLQTMGKIRARTGTGTWELTAQGGGRCLLPFYVGKVRKGRLPDFKDTEPIPSFWSENDGKGMQGATI